jgi:hypothetical protein
MRGLPLLTVAVVHRRSYYEKHCNLAKFVA